VKTVGPGYVGVLENLRLVNSQNWTFFGEKASKLLFTSIVDAKMAKYKATSSTSGSQRMIHACRLVKVLIWYQEYMSFPRHMFGSIDPMFMILILLNK